MAGEIGYKRTYKMRIVVPGRKHITVALPYEVIARQAELKGISVEYFIKTYEAVAEYDNFDGIRYTFKESDSENG